MQLADLTLIVVRREASRRPSQAQFALSGKTLDDGLTWLAAALTEGRALAGAGVRLERPRHELPPSPIAEGARFDEPAGSALAELEDWYASADRVLRAIGTAEPGASPVRCWPHHFDLATLIQLDAPDVPKERARSIGVGLSPGDVGIPEPYWYVTPWPPTASRNAPSLPAGHWQAQGWTGAALLASELAAAPASAAGYRVSTFLSAALAACHGLLGPRRAP